MMAKDAEAPLFLTTLMLVSNVTNASNILPIVPMVPIVESRELTVSKLARELFYLAYLSIADRNVTATVGIRDR